MNSASLLLICRTLALTPPRSNPISSAVKDLAQAKKIETRQKSYAANRLAPQLDGIQDESGHPRVVVPARAKRHSRLKAFVNAEEAYASGQWLRALAGRDEVRDNAREWCGQHGLDIRAVQTEGVNTAGGFLVPDPLEAGIIRLVEEFGVFRMKAANYPMTSDTCSVPKRTGGLTVYFPGEAGTITASDMTVGRVNLQARKLATLTRVTSELNEDSIISIMDLLAQEIALAFATSEDEQGFNGDGTATYGGAVGIKNALLAGSEYTAASGNTSFAELDDADFIGMMGQVAMYPGMMPEWYISPEGYYASMARLTTAAGGVNKQDIEDDFRPRFHGRPVNFVNVMNKVLTTQTSTEGICYYGDLRMGAYLGIRRGVTLLTDSSVYFATDEIALRATERIDVNVHETGTASVAGCIIQLLTPGS